MLLCLTKIKKNIKNRENKKFETRRLFTNWVGCRPTIFSLPKKRTGFASKQNASRIRPSHKTIFNKSYGIIDTKTTQIY